MVTELTREIRKAQRKKLTIYEQANKLRNKIGENYQQTGSYKLPTDKVRQLIHNDPQLLVRSFPKTFIEYPDNTIGLVGYD